MMSGFIYAAWEEGTSSEILANLERNKSATVARLSNVSLLNACTLNPERLHQHWQHMFGGRSQTAEWKILIDEKREWKWGAEGMSRGRKGGRKAVDATPSELSVMNKPRCLRDKADESECMCKILSSLLPQRIDTQHCPIFLDQILPRLTAALHLLHTSCVSEVYLCVVLNI